MSALRILLCLVACVALLRLVDRVKLSQNWIGYAGYSMAIAMVCYALSGSADSAGAVFFAVVVLMAVMAHVFGGRCAGVHRFADGTGQPAHVDGPPYSDRPLRR